MSNLEPRHSQSQKTILYIEDDPASRTLVERTLKFAGYRVLVAERGLQGVDMARTEQLDLILTDINLPDISGREVTTMLRAERKFDKIPIVALTAQAMDEQREMTMASGITGYLTKPIDVEALPDQIEQYLSGAKDHIEADRMADAQTRYAQEVVTRLEERIRELESVNESLRRLDTMKDSFIQLTAHELRTPLTLVFGYARLLEDTPTLKQVLENDEAVRTLVGGLVDSTERMQNIVNEILTVSRIMTNKVDLSIGPVNLGAIIKKITDKYSHALQTRRLNFQVEPKEGLPSKVRGDGDLIALVLDNLISNAIKYTPDEGHITITATKDDTSLRITIKDTGIGVSQADQIRIFDRFHTAGDTLLHSTSKTAFRGGGLGLGLAVCKAVAEAHGGSIRVKSPGFDVENPPGSEFLLSIPLVTENRKRTVQ
jgi:signal transduction histidine kinase